MQFVSSKHTQPFLQLPAPFGLLSSDAASILKSKIRIRDQLQGSSLLKFRVNQSLIAALGAVGGLGFRRGKPPENEWEPGIPYIKVPEIRVLNHQFTMS